MDIVVPAFISATLGLIVFFLGAFLTRRAGFLRDYNIPEPISGGSALAVVSETALSVFLAMSLMSMQLRTLASLGGPLVAVLAMQVATTVVFIAFVVFRAVGRGYLAAVPSAGFAGFALGATPTAIANMTAATKRYGPAPLAFIVPPLVSAFFADLANAFVIGVFVGL